jgi:hypothetical protein
MIRPFIGAYWSQRKETRFECAQRLANFLAAVSTEPLLGIWFLPIKSKSRKQTKPLPIETNAAAIEALLRTNNRDIDGTPIPELGFSISIWNGELVDPLSLSVRCGGYSKFVKNSAVLQFPACEIENSPTELDRLESLLKLFVSVWDPDRAVLSSVEELARSPGKTASDMDGLVAYREGKWR